MPVKVGETFSSAIDKLLKYGFVQQVMKNPIYTAIFIAVVIMLIVFIIFNDTDDPLYMSVLRVGAWTFMSTVVIMTIHNTVLLAKIDESFTQSEYDSAFAGAGTNLHTEEAYIPVEISQMEPQMDFVPTLKR